MDVSPEKQTEKAAEKLATPEAGAAPAAAMHCPAVKQEAKDEEIEEAGGKAEEAEVRKESGSSKAAPQEKQRELPPRDVGKKEEGEEGELKSEVKRSAVKAENGAPPATAAAATTNQASQPTNGNRGNGRVEVGGEWMG